MKQTTKIVLGVASIALLSSGVAGITTYNLLSKDKEQHESFYEMFQQNPSNVHLSAFNAAASQPVDLTKAAESSVHAVVHIKATQFGKT